MPHELFTTLRVEQTEPSELEHVLGEHLHGSRSEVPTEVDYPGVAGQHAIRAFYRGARIVDIQPGPALAEKDVVSKGPTRRFIEFADQFGPQNPDARAERRKLYSIRSSLSHGGKLLRSDLASWHGGLSEAKVTEWDNLDAASQLVRAVLVGWLAAQLNIGLEARTSGQ